MKKIGWILAYLAFLSLNAQAGLPPTTSKGSTDASPSTTFNLQFPEHRITHTGTTASVAPPKAVPNFIGQSSSWAVTSPDDRDLEASVGNWLAFANTVAGSLPDNGMTGGSPTVTCARSTTNPLDGAGSLLITKGASNLQGNGCSVVFNVQPAYQGGTATITASLNVSSGSIVQGDVKLFIYDVTNSKLITPSNNDVLSGPTLTATFPLDARAATPANQQYRLGVYFASTSATAVNLQLDNFSVSPGQAAYGMAGSNWLSYSMAITGSTTNPTKGTATRDTAIYRRVGDSVEIQYDYSQSSPGTAGSGTYLFSLPPGLTADTAKLTTGASDGLSQVGVGLMDASGSTTTTNTPVEVVLQSSTQLYLRLQTSFTVYTTVGSSTNSLANTKFYLTFHALIPIAGWDAGVSISPSQTFKISSYLASGTRVTSTPTALGQYRAQYFNGTALTDAAPTISPTASDGFRMYGNISRSAGQTGTSGQITNYQIYIGNPKNWKLECFQLSGKSGPLDVSNYAFSTSQRGIYAGYDPSTGVVTLDASSSESSGVTSRTLGFKPGTNSSLTDGYCDLTVSDNALSVGMDATQVISNNKGERIERATLSLTSASVASIASQSGSWLSSVSASSSVVTVNFTAGMFSAAPSCSITCDNSNGGGASTGEPLTAISTSTFNFGCVNASSALTNGGKAYLICMGPR